MPAFGICNEKQEKSHVFQGKFAVDIEISTRILTSSHNPTT
ncbi:hypothetical protein [Moraxella lacunata]